MDNLNTIGFQQLTERPRYGTADEHLHLKSHHQLYAAAHIQFGQAGLETHSPVRQRCIDHQKIARRIQYRRKFIFPDRYRDTHDLQRECGPWVRGLKEAIPLPRPSPHHAKRAGEQGNKMAAWQSKCR